MRTKPFIIQFETNEICTKDFNCSVAYKYEALITTLSKGFNLFKVSGIKRITNEGIVHLAAEYYLTSYPLPNKKDNSWKDPLTFCSNSFLQAVGISIENHIEKTSKQKAKLLQRVQADINQYILTDN
jgi:hypothetical protein